MFPREVRDAVRPQKLREAPLRVDVQGRSRPDTLSLKIANVGENTIHDLWIVGHGQVNFRDVPSIVRSLGLHDMTERERALALWDFIRNQCYHHFSAETGMEVHHPTKFFCVYGYGLCDDFAENFQVLADRASLGARMVGLGNIRGTQSISSVGRAAHTVLILRFST